MSIRDPWHFQRWAFDTTVGNPVRKAVLSMLAMMADANTGRGEVKQDTLAQGVEASERAVRGHLKALDDAGIIARRAQFRRDRGRRGDEFLLLAPGIDEWPDGEPVQPAPSAGGGGTDGYPPRGTQPSGQELPPRNGHASTQDSAPDPRNALPEDFPDELRPHARAVYKVLREIAVQHSAKEVTPLALGRVIASRRRKPLVRSAHDFAAWAADPPRPIRDVVATYRSWLDRGPTLAAVEQLDDDGLPTDGPAVRRGRNDAAMTEAKRAKAERSQRGREAIGRLTGGDSA